MDMTTQALTMNARSPYNAGHDAGGAAHDAGNPHAQMLLSSVPARVDHPEGRETAPVLEVPEPVLGQGAEARHRHLEAAPGLPEARGEDHGLRDGDYADLVGVPLWARPDAHTCTTRELIQDELADAVARLKPGHCLRITRYRQTWTSPAEESVEWTGPETVTVEIGGRPLTAEDLGTITNLPFTLGDASGSFHLTHMAMTPIGLMRLTYRIDEIYLS